MVFIVTDFFFAEPVKKKKGLTKKSTAAKSNNMSAYLGKKISPKPEASAAVLQVSRSC